MAQGELSAARRDAGIGAPGLLPVKSGSGQVAVSRPTRGSASEPPGLAAALGEAPQASFPIWGNNAVVPSVDRIETSNGDMISPGIIVDGRQI